MVSSGMDGAKLWREQASIFRRRRVRVASFGRKCGRCESGAPQDNSRSQRSGTADGRRLRAQKRAYRSSHCDLIDFRYFWRAWALVKIFGYWQRDI